MAIVKGSLLAAIARDLERRLDRLFRIESDPPRLRLSRVGMCPRQTVWSVREGIEADLTEAAGILAAGKLYEAFIAEMFENEEIIPQMEVELAGIKGHLDFYLPRLKLVIECKTIATSRIDSAKLPIEHHVAQLHAYLSALKDMGYGENYGAIIYLPRENPRLYRVFTFAYDETKHSELVLTLEMLKDAIENDKVPPIPEGYSPNSFPCSWFSRISRIHLRCPFFERCWSKEAPQRQHQEMEAVSEITDNTTQMEMDQDLEDLVSLLYELKLEKQRIDDEIKACREQILEAVTEKLKAAGRKVNLKKLKPDDEFSVCHLVGQFYGLTIAKQIRNVLDTEALSKVVDLSAYRKPSVATVVDVYRVRK